MLRLRLSFVQCRGVSSPHLVLRADATNDFGMQRHEKYGVKVNAMISIVRPGSILNLGYFKQAKSKETLLGGTFFLFYR